MGEDESAEQSELSLDDALAEAAEEAEAEAEQATGEAKETEEAETEAAEESEASETETEEPEASATPAEAKPKDDEPWHVKAVMTEREKRQAAERRADELEKQLKDQESKAPKTSVFEDEAKWQAEREQEIQNRLDNQRYNVSRALAVREFGQARVDEAMDAFKTLAAGDKLIARDIFDSDLPYIEMVEFVDRHNKAKELDNIDEYRERIRAEERAKLEKEHETKQKARSEKREGITPSLASARSTGGTEDLDHLTTVEEVLPE